jgi:hypothetical protein
MSDKFGVKTLSSCTALAFVLGWLTPEAVGHLQAARHEQSPAAGALPVAAPKQEGVEADALSRFKAIDWTTQDPDAAGELVSALSDNAALRQVVLERYRQEPQGLAKARLALLLTERPLPEVIAAAVAWAQDPDSATARADGFTILRNTRPQLATYRLMRQALEHEQDPVALGAAVWGMSSPQDVPDPAEAEQVVPRLHALTRHPMADVRSASIQRLAEWDRAQRYIEGDVLRLLSDPDRGVREAAVGATSIAWLTSASVKQRLFALLASEKADDEFRSIVLLQFSRFALTRQEYSAYQAVSHELFGKADEPVGR